MSVINLKQMTYMNKCSTLISLINSIRKKTPFKTFSTAELQENQVKIDNYSINYVRAGNGRHNILFLPGSMGTVWTDFVPQLEGLDKTKYTLIFIDLPGCGKSRPPNRDFSQGKLLFYRDATIAAKLMEVLKVPKYSVLGWCDGGTTGLILAALNTDKIEKLITLSAMSYINERDMELQARLRDVSNWSTELLKPREKCYGQVHLKELWSDWYENRVSILKNETGDMCKDILSNIKAETLIIQGDEDSLVRWEHALCLANNIPNSRLHLVKGGSHFIQLRDPELFNGWIDNFLCSSKGNKS